MKILSRETVFTRITEDIEVQTSKGVILIRKYTDENETDWQPACPSDHALFDFLSDEENDELYELI